MANLISEEEDRKFIHEANNHLFIIKGTSGILRRKLTRELGEGNELLQRLDKIETAVDTMTEMFKNRRQLYIDNNNE